MSRKPVVALLSSLVLLSASCGPGETSLTDYVERVNELAADAGEKAVVMVADIEAIDDFSPRDIQASLERGLNEIRIPLQEAVDELRPPDEIEDLHSLLWGWHAEFIAVERALATRASLADDTAAAWEELSASSEMVAYRNSLAEGKQVCLDFQNELDATAARGAFVGAPWIPGEMKQAVEAALGCLWFPENPDDVYRYPPPAS